MITSLGASALRLVPPSAHRHSCPHPTAPPRSTVLLPLSTHTQRPLSRLHASRVTSIATPSSPDSLAPHTSAVPPFLLGALTAAALLLGIQKLLGTGKTQTTDNQLQASPAGPVVQAAPAAPAAPVPPLPTTKESFQQYSSSTPAFSMAGTQCWGRLVDVYDGDTVKIVLPLGGKMYKFSVRMFGIDTCEMRSKVQSNKDKAVAARNRVIELGTGISPLPPIQSKKDTVKLLDQQVSLVWVECLEFDKYGRLLAKVFNGPGQAKSFSQVLLDEKLAYEYFGETKLTEAEQEALV